jgi:hypothetical protein
MITPKQQKAIELYTILMFEAKIRLETINLITTGPSNVVPGIAHELGYLQLRMLCETIALACLVAHGDLTQPMIRKFDREYAADKILKMMEGLDQAHFPEQAIFSAKSIRANTKPNAITKKEVIKLYAICGERLHRGQVKVITNSDQLKRTVRFDESVKWGQKIEDLLGTHIVPLFANETDGAMLICVLRDINNGLNPTVKRLGFSRHAPD